MTCQSKLNSGSLNKCPTWFMYCHNKYLIIKSSIVLALYFIIPPESFYITISCILRFQILRWNACFAMKWLCWSRNRVQRRNYLPNKKLIWDDLVDGKSPTALVNCIYIHLKELLLWKYFSSAKRFFSNSIYKYETTIPNIG